MGIFQHFTVVTVGIILIAILLKIFREIRILKARTERAITKRQVYEFTKYLCWTLSNLKEEIKILKDTQNKKCG